MTSFWRQVACEICGALPGALCRKLGEDCACPMCKAIAAARARGDLYCGGGIRSLMQLAEGDVLQVAGTLAELHLERYARVRGKRAKKMGTQQVSKCDAEACAEQVDGAAVPVPPGWVRRTLVDSIGPSQPGDTEFSGHQMFLFCPKHSGLLKPLLAPTVLAELGRREEFADAAAKAKGKSGG